MEAEDDDVETIAQFSTTLMGAMSDLWDMNPILKRTDSITNHHDNIEFLRNH